MVELISLPESARWTIPTEGDGPGLRVSIAVPAASSPSTFPAVVLLDGDFLFLTATEFVRSLHLVTMGDFPPVAVIGIMRDESDPLRYISSRFRDFTPQTWTLTGPFADDNAMAWMGTGGAAAFLNCIENSVLPRVAEHLALSGHQLGRLAVAGWSLSGLFASWAWLERPDLFSDLLAISPSLWWNDASILDRPFLPRPEGHKAFVCAGEHEEGAVDKVYPRRFANAAQREMAAMVRNAATFGVLASQTGADVDAWTFSEEHHVTVQPAALARGLRHIFG